MQVEIAEQVACCIWFQSTYVISISLEKIVTVSSFELFTIALRCPLLQLSH